MVIYLRGWIQNIGLKDAFRSHILILMVIFFLQLHNHLPGIDRLQENQEPTVGRTYFDLNMPIQQSLKLNIFQHGLLRSIN